MQADHPLYANSIDAKIETLEMALNDAVSCHSPVVPDLPARGGLNVLPPNLHPPKKGLGSLEGRARLLHDLANIELQAMELCLRTLMEYPDAPAELKDELVALTISEGRHLKMCIDGLSSLGFKWGDWPVHLALWEAVHSSDSLTDRIFIVHRYLEGSGLDAQDTLLRRMEGVHDPLSHSILKQIHREEVDHVYFGSHWFRELIKLEERKGVQESLSSRLLRLRSQLPKRVEPICHRWRLQAGFTPEEIEDFETFRQSWLIKR